MAVMYIKFKDGHIKDGHIKSYKIKHFLIVGSTIRVETEDNIVYFEYETIESLEIIYC